MKVLSGSSTTKIAPKTIAMTARSIRQFLKRSPSPWAAAAASAITVFTGRPSARAAAATSSNSGCTLTTSPSSRATLTAIVCPSTSTVVIARSSSCLPTGCSRRPIVEVCR